MKQLNKTAYHFSVSFILISFFTILIFLNKKETKVDFTANSNFIDKAILIIKA
jgi:regulatory protein YycI of two-component signal transduction system YycFG